MSNEFELEAADDFVGTLFEEFLASPLFAKYARRLSTARLQQMRREVDEVMAERYAPLRGDGKAGRA